MYKNEWFKQADYDMDTAEFMLSGERFFLFLIHILFIYRKGSQRTIYSEIQGVIYDG